MTSCRFVLSLFFVSLIALTSAAPLQRERVARLLQQKFASLIQKKSDNNFLTDFIGNLFNGNNGNGNILNGNGNPLNGNGNFLNGNGNPLNGNGNILNGNGNILNGNGNPLNGNGNILNGHGNPLNGNGNILNGNGNPLNGNGNFLNGNGNPLNGNGNILNGGHAPVVTPVPKPIVPITAMPIKTVPIVTVAKPVVPVTAVPIRTAPIVSLPKPVVVSLPKPVVVSLPKPVVVSLPKPVVPTPIPSTSGQNPLHLTRGPGGLSFEIDGDAQIENNHIKDTVYGISIDVSQLIRSNYPQQAFHFNDVVIPVNFNLNPSVHPALSIELWVKLDNAINNRGWIIGHDNGGFDRSVILTDDRYGGIAFGTGSSYTSTLGLLEKKVWTHIVGTYQNGRQMTMYRDYTKQQVVAVNNNEGEPTMTLGGLQNFPGQTVDAWIGELRIYDFVLSSQQVQSLYQYRKTIYGLS